MSMIPSVSEEHSTVLGARAAKADSLAHTNVVNLLLGPSKYNCPIVWISIEQIATA